MATTITCEQCGDSRKAQYKNTKYCIKCALLRDVTFVGDRRYACEACDNKFAPVGRRDPYCGACAIGCGQYLPCALCALDPDFSDEDGYHELHRRGVPLCVRCVRDPATRPKLIRSLRKGQLDRAKANGIGVTQRRSDPAPPKAPLPYDPPTNRFMIDLKRDHPKTSQSESNPALIARLLEAGVLEIVDRTLARKETP